LLKCAGSFAFIASWWSAIRLAPVGDCIAIIYCSPILTSLMSRALLKEVLPRKFPLQVLLVSTGCLLVLDPPFLHSHEEVEGASPRGDYRLVFLALWLASIVPIITRKAKDCSWIEVEHVSACLASTLLDPSMVLVQYVIYGELPPVPAAAPKEVFLPSVHPHPLEPCHRNHYCDVRGPGCRICPTAYTSVECEGWDICQVCFDKAPREGPEPTGAKDSLAELLHEISIATHEEEGDAQEDDMGEAMVDDDDEDVDLRVLFQEAQRHAVNAPRNDDEDEEDDY